MVLGWSGGDPDDPGSYQVVDFQRGGSLAWLAALFAAAVLVLGPLARARRPGRARPSASGCCCCSSSRRSWTGRSPLAVAVVGAGVIMFAVLYLTHGLSARDVDAPCSARWCRLALIGAPRRRVHRRRPAHRARTTRPRRSSASLGTGVDARGLLVAGIVVGALGVLDDVTVTQVSAVRPRCGGPTRGGGPGRSTRGRHADQASAAWPRRSTPSCSPTPGRRCRCCCCSASPGRSLGDVATSQDVATEIVRTLVGSIGLVASVPVTTAVAALVACRERGRNRRGEVGGRAESPRRRARGRAASSRPPKRRAQLPRRCPERARFGVDLGQHGDREQPARGQGGDRQIPFASLGSQHFGKELFGNMIASGAFCRLATIEFDEAAIRESLPKRYVEENLAAIRYGYDLTAEEIARLASAAPPSRFQMNTAATAD